MVRLGFHPQQSRGPLPAARKSLRQYRVRLPDKGRAAIPQNQAAADRIAALSEIRFGASIHPAFIDLASRPTNETNQQHNRSLMITATLDFEEWRWQRLQHRRCGPPSLTTDDAGQAGWNRTTDGKYHVGRE